MHSRRPLRIASAIGSIETGRRVAHVSEGAPKRLWIGLLADEAETVVADFGRAKRGTSLFLRRDQIPTNPR
jgi:hypothetical protein